MALKIRNMNEYGSDVAEVCSVTNTWFSEDFTIYLYADGNWRDIPAQFDILEQMAQKFAKKWEFINEINEPYEEEFPLVSYRGMYRFSLFHDMDLLLQQVLH